jgi:hypothetical protein
VLRLWLWHIYRLLSAVTPSKLDDEHVNLKMHNTKEDNPTNVSKLTGGNSLLNLLGELRTIILAFAVTEDRPVDAPAVHTLKHVSPPKLDYQLSPATAVASLTSMFLRLTTGWDGALEYSALLL